MNIVVICGNMILHTQKKRIINLDTYMRIFRHFMRFKNYNLEIQISDNFG